MPDKYKPDKNYVRHIPNRRLHAYTLIQVLMFLLLCIFQAVQQISIVFPIMVRGGAGSNSADAAFG